MNKNQLSENMIIVASDRDLSINYKGSEAKGKRNFLLLKIDFTNEVVYLVYFSKKNFERENEREYLELNELPESVLRLNQSPKKIPFNKLPYMTEETHLSDDSVRKIKQAKTHSNHLP